MKILIVAGRAESLINFRGVLISELISRGHEIHVAAGDMSGSNDTQKKLIDMGCKTHHYFLRRTGINPFHDLFTLISLLQLMLRIRPQGIFAYTIKPVIYSLLISRLVGVKKRYCLISGLGYAFQGNNQRNILKAIAQKLYQYAINCADKVFFQNPDDQQLFASRGLLKKTVSVVVNGSGVDLKHYSHQPLPKKDITFLMLARLLGDKGVREYAASAKVVKEKHPLAKFNLAGAIDINPSAISKAELDNWVSAGTINYLGDLSDVRPAISDCHVFVLPSYREGTPRSVLEAMAIGRAVITTNAPGCKETVQHGTNGFLVPVQDVEQLYASMIQLIENPSLIYTMANESLNLVKEKYDVHKVNQHLITEMNL